MKKYIILILLLLLINCTNKSFNEKEKEKEKEFLTVLHDHGILRIYTFKYKNNEYLVGYTGDSIHIEPVIKNKEINEKN